MNQQSPLNSNHFELDISHLRWKEYFSADVRGLKSLYLSQKALVPTLTLPLISYVSLSQSIL